MIKIEERLQTKSCWNQALDSERVFVLLARDPAAPATIRAWVAQRIYMRKNCPGDPEIIEALDCATKMEQERDEVRLQLIDRSPA